MRRVTRLVERMRKLEKGYRRRETMRIFPEEKRLKARGLA
jgi:hypothetical protein